MDNGQKYTDTQTNEIHCPVMIGNLISCSQSRRCAFKGGTDDDGLEPLTRILKMFHKTTQEVFVIVLEKEFGMYENSIATEKRSCRIRSPSFEIKTMCEYIKSSFC